MNNKERGIIFRQSLHDFPCPVMLGRCAPSFGLHRFKQGLRFVPPDDEGFTLRGDKRRLLYKGRRRSHRFTIIGDMAFEYDCILKREPESNVITLRIEGAENFDFFRQPDFVPDDFLKGSYAVYKKQTLVGEGTGKLCHIHRPEIIDARGRRCWGDLSVVGDELRITIPEWFLSEAKYPVIVDPTIGTTTVGSQYIWDDARLLFELSIPVNRFLVPDTINGLCTAHVYVNFDEYEAGGRPVFYSDNSDSPLTRKSMDEGFINMRVTGGNPAGWRSATFSSSESIVNGSYIWFGVFCEYFWFPRFDFGAKCYCDWWWDEYDSIPDTYPLYYMNWYDDFRLSMYFTYTSAQNYQRTITQGVTLSDNWIMTGEYKRTTAQTVQTVAIVNSLQIKIRKILEAVKSLDDCLFPVLFVRNNHETVKTPDIVSHMGTFFRGIFENAFIDSEAKGGWVYFTKIRDTVRVAGTVLRGLILLVRIVTGAFVRDYLLRRFLRARTELTLKSCVVREICLESKIN